jgi:hypothetical protein
MIQRNMLPPSSGKTGNNRFPWNTIIFTADDMASHCKGLSSLQSPT